MKPKFCVMACVCASFLLPAIAVYAQDAPAGPVIGTKSPSGPSAKRAAQLKYHPPQNYLKHYLGDDRYKIEGGVWKVVSTQLDTYYHRANCPNMLKQSADIVIGFSSDTDAEEGGYRACSTCQPKAETALYSPLAAAMGMTGYVTTARRINLADGSSSVMLPAGWARMMSQSRNDTLFGIKRRSNVDIFQRKGSKGMVIVSTTVWPGVNVEERFNTLIDSGKGADNTSGNEIARKQKEEWLSGVAATNPTGRGVSGVVSGFLTNAKKVKWGGMTAYTTKIDLNALKRSNAKAADVPIMNIVSAAKGSKSYSINDMDGSSGAKTIRDSFRPN
jgi:methylphosphotriester-DNA--protein-cysteine methyltransferase